jgi:hypothetical protein
MQTSEALIQTIAETTEIQAVIDVPRIARALLPCVQRGPRNSRRCSVLSVLWVPVASDAPLD